MGILGKGKAVPLRQPNQVTGPEAFHRRGALEESHRGTALEVASRLAGRPWATIQQSSLGYSRWDRSQPEETTAASINPETIESLSQARLIVKERQLRVAAIPHSSYRGILSPGINDGLRSL